MVVKQINFLTSHKSYLPYLQVHHQYEMCQTAASKKWFTPKVEDKLGVSKPQEVYLKSWSTLSICRQVLGLFLKPPLLRHLLTKVNLCF